MKTLWLLIVLTGFGASVSLAENNGTIVSENALNHVPTLTPYQQQQLDEANSQYLQQQAAIAAEKAAQKKAEKDAAAQAEYDAALAPITKEKDEAIAKLNGTYNPSNVIRFLL